MNGEKMSAARGAIARFVNDLLERNDELFLYRFSNYPVLVQGWTRDRRDLIEPLGRLVPYGATAMYDAIARAIPLAQQGQNRKKALVVISDGNDTSSRTDVGDLKQQIRESEVLVYAVGIDGDGDGRVRRGAGAAGPHSGSRLRRRFRRSSRQADGRKCRHNRPSGVSWPPPTIASTRPRCGRSPTTAEDAPKSCASRRPRSRHGGHRR
jgi:VWFA-related protein